ncbi:MAG: DUF5658 family protein [Gammaproteobacteria bacterium]|nr:DUF5658 family protein [Gammaproteobacteria bacterium]
MSTFESEQKIISSSSSDLDRREENERRNPTLKGFILGCFKCQRRDQRRANCNAHYRTDWYDTKLFIMALGILFLSVADAAMTMTLLNNGAVEINPFMNYLLKQSIHAFVYTKLALTSVCIFVLVAHYHSKLFNTIRVDILLTFALMVYSILVIYELILYFIY